MERVNSNFQSQIAMKDIYDIDEGFEGLDLQYKNSFLRRVANKHILTCLDEKFHCKLGLLSLEYLLYPQDDEFLNFFGLGSNYPWVRAGGQITHIKEDCGVIYAILNYRYVARLQHTKSWYIKEPFSLTNTFKTEGQCCCLAHLENGVVLCIKFPEQFKSATSTPQLHIFDSNGKFQDQIIYNHNKPILNDPRDMAVMQSTIIISDQGNKSVVFVDRYGAVLCNYTHDEISCPRGLCVDQYFNIYVASEGKIIQITEDLSQCRTIVSLPNQEISFLRFCQKTNLLSASYDGTGKIANYQFLQNNRLTIENREENKKSIKDPPPYLWLGVLCLAYTSILIISVSLSKK